MANNLYTTKTAALKATRADVRDLNTKKLSLNGKNILDYISDSEFNSYDTRDPQLKNDELDVWNTAISLSEEGHIEVKPHVHSIVEYKWDNSTDENTYTYEGITESQHSTLQTAAKIIDGEVLRTDNAHLMYWQTDGLTNGQRMFWKCENLTTFTSDLSSLNYGGGMFYECSNLRTFSSDLSSLTNGTEMFMICSKLTSFSSNLSSMTSGVNMFYECSKLTTFTSDLSSLTNGNSMFGHCSALTKFISNLSSLTNGRYMFSYCEKLTTFTSDSSGTPVNLSSLTDGEKMFYLCTALTTFTSDLSSLTKGTNMFASCSKLTSFTSDLPSLTDGTYMFSNCSALTAFSSDLSSLTTGQNMFRGCILDAQSVANIIHTLSTYSGRISIGIGCDNTEADKLLFAQECDCDTWQELLDDFSAKNWTVTFQCNGRPTTTYNMRRGETLPIYTKLEEVTEGEHYDYTSADGSKFYNIDYFHSTNGSTEGYDVFSSLEEAISTYNVTPKN